MFHRVYAPLIAGFIVFVLLAVLIGWFVDPSRGGDSGSDHH
ncbi:MAG TPA: hypothetical protein VG186_07865 [Solirubrobacteraceae bacterium]|jgi:hypothetical protein|nr:hypothetical protein [Solirubrobacteraceae bacterium]